MSTRARVNYHVKKTVRQAFELDGHGESGQLVAPELATNEVCVSDLRAGANPPSFDTDGVVFVHRPTAVKDFRSDDACRATYEAELSELLKQQIGAEDVIVFDHTVRVDDPHAARRPARNVHNDFTRASAEHRLVELLGETQARKLREGRFGFVNIWRPIEHPVESSPLGFIRPASMHPDDWMDIDVIYPDRVGQVLGVAANDRHQWFYRSGMTPDEAIVFCIYDNGGRRPHIAHSALDLVERDQTAAVRMSIESRSLVTYASAKRLS